MIYHIHGDGEAKARRNEKIYTMNLEDIINWLDAANNNAGTYTLTHDETVLWAKAVRTALQERELIYNFISELKIDVEGLS